LPASWHGGGPNPNPPLDFLLTQERADYLFANYNINPVNGFELREITGASGSAAYDADLEVVGLYGKIDAEIAGALMSINAVKGVEIGAGFGCVAQKGSEHGDELTPEGFRSNHAGGVLGGISTGQDLVVSIAIKPTSSIRIPRASIDRAGKATVVETFGRHDPCVGIRATPIAEAMLALVLMDHMLRHRAQNFDTHSETPVIPAQAPGLPD